MLRLAACWLGASLAGNLATMAPTVNTCDAGRLLSCCASAARPLRVTIAVRGCAGCEHDRPILRPSSAQTRRQQRLHHRQPPAPPSRRVTAASWLVEKREARSMPGAHAAPQAHNLHCRCRCPNKLRGRPPFSARLATSHPRLSALPRTPPLRNTPAGPAA